MTFGATILIVALWLAVICVIIKLDIGGFGSSVVTPILKDVPVLNRILPGNSVTETTNSGAYGGYTSLQDAVDQIKSLELQLEQIQNASSAKDEELDQLKAESSQAEGIRKISRWNSNGFRRNSMTRSFIPIRDPERKNIRNIMSPWIRPLRKYIYETGSDSAAGESGSAGLCGRLFSHEAEAGSGNFCKVLCRGDVAESYRPWTQEKVGIRAAQLLGAGVDLGHKGRQVAA